MNRDNEAYAILVSLSIAIIGTMFIIKTIASFF